MILHVIFSLVAHHDAIFELTIDKAQEKQVEEVDELADTTKCLKMGYNK
jgi:hypothetical protein